MVRLPTREDLGQLPTVGRGPVSAPQPQAPDYRAGVVDYRVRTRAAEMQARRLLEVGRGLSAAAAALDSVKREDDATDLIRADTQAASSRMETSRSVIEKPDAYDTWGEDFAVQQGKNDEAAASLIRNPQLKERFQLKNQLDTAQERDRILDLAVRQDKAFKLANINAALEADKQMYLSPDASNQDKARIANSMDNKLGLAMRAGIITPAQYATYRDKYVKGIVKEDAEILLLNNPDQLKRELDGVAPFQRALKQRESGGNPAAINKLGYAGFYQFGAPRLVDLGFYRLGKGEYIDDKGKWTGEKWVGSFNIPDFPEVNTIDDFLANPDAQEAVFKAHVRLMDREIKKNGFDQYVGHVVGGTPITNEGLYGMIHLGGVVGARRALESQGEDSPADANGTTVLDYANLAAPYSRYASLDLLDRAEISAKAQAAIDRDPDLREHSREIAKTGYDMLLEDKMDPDWLKANRDVLTVSDYKAFLHGLEPGGTNRKMEPSEYLRLYDLTNNDPEKAQTELRDLYGRDEIAKDDFKSLFSKAQQTAKSARGRPYQAELRDYVHKQLAPSARDPKSLQSRQLDALFQFDDWIEAHPGATREETRKEAQIIIDDYRQIRYASGVTELPVPRFIDVSRDNIDAPALDTAKAKTVEELRSGSIDANEAAKQAATLRRWYELLQYRKAK